MNDNVYKALGVFLDAMRLYVVSSIQNNFPKEPWEGVFFERLPASKQQSWNMASRTCSRTEDLIDYGNLTQFALSFKSELIGELGKDANKLATWLQELQEVRNKCQHYQTLDEDEVERAFSTMRVIAKLLGMPDLVAELEIIKKPVAAVTVEIKPIDIPKADFSYNEDSLLPSWFNNVQPHFDISQGNLDESVFAANLGEVALDSGREVYRNAALFFQETYVTAGLKNIANRMIRALNGEETENRVVSLQTGFGGGKTHTLISLYHMAKAGKGLISFADMSQIFDPEVTPKFENAKVAVFTDNTTDVAQGREIGKDTVIYTLWGELAYQLGGWDAYEKIKDNDQKRIAPSASLFKKIITEAVPCLILIDELANYCNKAAGIPVGNGTLSDQTISFIQALTEVVSSVRRSVLIATLPASATEVASTEIGSRILTALETRIIRVGASVKPVEDDEIFEVVRRRLFRSIGDPQVIELVINRYRNTYHNRRTDLPAYADRMEYFNKMKKAYPFHPELIDMFRLRWGNDSRFQRTRGVLRLLASIVSDLWRRRSSLTGTQALIHTSDVNLSNVPSLTGTITSLMGNQWETVMQADIMGSSSNAYRVDEDNSNLGKYNLTQGIATTILMGSFGDLQNKGLTIDQLKLCTYKPNAFNHNDVNGALSKLEAVAHYLYSSSGGNRSYWFQAKPNLNILINQARNMIDADAVDVEILRRLTYLSRGVNSFHVLVNPTADIPEQKNLTLVILAPEYAIQAGNINPKTRKEIEKIALYKGNSDRIYRNTILYLACSETGRSKLERVRDYLACEKILEDYTGRLDREQQQELRQKKEELDRQVNRQIINAYSVVVKHSAKEGLKFVEITSFSDDFSAQINTNLIQTIKDIEWLLDRIGMITFREYNLLPTVDCPLRLNEIAEAFLRFDDKPMLSNVEALYRSIGTYCQNGEFNIACGDHYPYNKIYHLEPVPFLDMTDLNVWLVDKSVLPPKVAETPAPSSTEKTNTEGRKGTEYIPCPVEDKTYVVSELQEIKSVTISGKIPVQHFTDLFTSFVIPLKDNELEIEVKFKGKTNPFSTLSTTSLIYKSIKESARQLGLDFEEEV